ncbi:MAG: cyclic nucleotide-binding domain-containing protein [Verrucomicrobiaceae bacterium]|nr:cyclic nucleotide-binding domain-containing protein [Verrucomicrobiaceae bacterium]
MTTPTKDTPPDLLAPEGLMMEIDESVRNRLVAAGRFETLAVGHQIATQDRPHYAISATVSGKVAVSCRSRDDNVVIDELGPGDIIGEMSVIDYPHVASADVIVLDRPAHVWTIDGEAFDTFIESDPKMGLAVMRLLARELCCVIRHNSVSMLKQAEALRFHYQDMDY